MDDGATGASASELELELELDCFELLLLVADADMPVAEALFMLGVICSGACCFSIETDDGGGLLDIVV